MSTAINLPFPVLNSIILKYLNATGETALTQLNNDLKLLFDDLFKNKSNDNATIKQLIDIYTSAIELLSGSIPNKLAAFVIFKSIIDVGFDNQEVETMRNNIMNACREIDMLWSSKVAVKIETVEILLRYVASLIGHYAAKNNADDLKLIINFNVVRKKLKHDCDFFLAALIIVELANNNPSTIFKDYDTNANANKDIKLFEVCLKLVDHKKAIVQVAAAEALECVFRVVAQRNQIALEGILRQGLNNMNYGITSDVTERIIGSLIILEVMVKGVVTTSELHNALKELKYDFNDVVWKVLSHKDSSNNEIKRKVIDMIPYLAGVFQSAFTTSTSKDSNGMLLLQYCYKYLMDIIKKKTVDRPYAYISLGKLVEKMANAFRSTHANLITEIMTHFIDDGFRDPFCIQVLQCIGMVLTASSSSRTFINTNFVNSMFKGDLTIDLLNCLRIVIKLVSSMRSHIQNRLIHHVKSTLLRYVVLMDETHKYANGRPRFNGKGNSSTHRLSFISPQKASPGKHYFGVFGSMISESLAAQTTDTDELIIFALQIISNVDFFPRLIRDRGSVVSTETDQSLNLISVVRDAVVRYLDDANPSVRATAAMTCVYVLDNVSVSIDPKSKEFTFMVQIMDRLLIVGIGDDLKLRSCIFSSITPSLDHIVALSRSIHCIIDSLDDESIEIRSASMALLSRVAYFDELHILPIMTLHLKRLLRQLNGSSDKMIREDSLQLLQSMVKGNSALILPFVNQILVPLISILNDPVRDIVSLALALSTIGELAILSPESLRPHHDIIFSCLINGLNDESSIMLQETAVVVLGKLVSSLTAETEAPYIKYPALFDAIVRAIKTVKVSASDLRSQSIRTAGLLGPVEVDIYQQHLRENAIGKDELLALKKVDEIDHKVDDDHSEKKSITKIDRYNFNVVMREVISVFQNNNKDLIVHHQEAFNIAQKLIISVGTDSFEYVDLLVNTIIHRLSDTGNEHLLSFREQSLIQIKILVDIVKQPIVKYKESLVKIVCDSLNSHLQHSLLLLESLCFICTVHEVQAILERVMPIIGQIIKDESISDASSSVSNNEDLTVVEASTSIYSKTKKFQHKKIVSIVEFIVNLAFQLGKYYKLLIPMTLRIVESEETNVDIRINALKALMILGKSADLHEFSSLVIHSLMRMLSTNETSLQGLILTTLSSLLCKLGPGYIPYILPVYRKLKSNISHVVPGSTKLPQLEEYESLVSRLLSHRTLPSEVSSYSDLEIKSAVPKHMYTSSHHIYDDSIHPTNNNNELEVAYALTGTGRNNEKELKGWVINLATALLNHSPSRILKQCGRLAKMYSPLALNLFNASFYCVWDEYYYADECSANIMDQKEIIKSIENALNSPHTPHDVLNILLNLVEFMDMQNKRLPIDTQLLARRAEAANNFSKCLRYRELEFTSVHIIPSDECVEALIAVNNELGLNDRAAGVLTCMMKNYPNSHIQPLWLEKLLRWDDARNAYTQQKLKLLNETPLEITAGNSDLMDIEIGILRCLQSLGEYAEIEENAVRLKENCLKMEENVEARTYKGWMAEITAMGANASWILGHWETMSEFLEGDKVSNTYDIELTRSASFYKAILAIQNQRFNQALAIIAETRNELTNDFRSLLSENYSRAYRAMISMQILAEMEEVIQYKEAVRSSAMDTKETASNSSLGGRQLKKTLSGIGFSDVKDSNSSTIDLTLTKSSLLRKWRGRMKWAPKDIDVYRQILTVRSLVAEPIEDLDSWLELVTLCRKEGMFSLCENLLRRLGAPLYSKRKNTDELLLDDNLVIQEPLNIDVTESIGDLNGPELSGITDSPTGVTTNYRVMFSTFKYWWASGSKHTALFNLSKFIDNIDVYISEKIPQDDVNYFKVQCLLRRAEWMRELDEYPLDEVLETVQKATTIAPEYYSVWHVWAVTNYDYLKMVDTKESNESKLHSLLNHNMSHKSLSYSSVKGSASLANLQALKEEGGDSAIDTYIINAIDGFVKSLMYSKGQSMANILQDTLRLLTLWFSYGGKDQIGKKLKSSLQNIELVTWLSVIPQLIARMNVKSIEISKLLRKTLGDIAKKMPQAIVFPISVALNTNDNQQKQFALDILHQIPKHKNIGSLVDEAAMVSVELMRVAQTPHELWHDGLEKAAAHYLEFKDINAMVVTLSELHETMVGKPTKKMEGTSSAIDKYVGNISLRDISFRQSYERQVIEAMHWLDSFKKSGRTTDLHQCWEIYYSIFQRIVVQIEKFKNAKTELPHASPALQNAKDLTLAVPGTYTPTTDDKAIIKISKFSSEVKVMPSKQRPRRIAIFGSNGKWYHFLLKGKEDLRQDERVMQLFGLINLCLDNDRVTKNRNLAIVRYSVLPLSNNSGLIGWVDNCDTINSLVLEYRKSNQINQNIEKVLVQSLSSPNPSKKNINWNNYYKLPLLQKVEVFKQVLDETTGRDLANVIWEKSKTADVWVERRANFTKSMAVMSIVGYILGLGDRHPSNLMLDRVSGRVVHIDFGDCFEVTSKRPICPEIIPFRLTRMISTTMEASGILGTYRANAQRTMRVIRINRDSVMAMLEAFVYDPLISWRLLTTKSNVIDSMNHSFQDTNVPQSSMDRLKQHMNITTTIGLGATINTSDIYVEQLNASGATMGLPSETLQHMSYFQNGISFNDTKQQRRKSVVDAPTTDDTNDETLNTRALDVITRIQAKLSGRDFCKDDDDDDLNVEQQVDRLIKEATSIENLCQLFIGWCPLCRPRRRDY